MTVSRPCAAGERQRQGALDWPLTPHDLCPRVALPVARTCRNSLGMAVTHEDRVLHVAGSARREKGPFRGPISSKVSDLIMAGGSV